MEIRKGYYRPEKLKQNYARAGHRSLDAYIAVMVLAGAALAAALAAFRPYHAQANPFLAAAFLALVCLAGLYPVHVAPKTKISVTSAAIFAAVLLFDPLTAVIIGGAGVAATQLFTKKKDWINRVFSTSQAVLFTGTARDCLRGDRRVE